jgi:RNA polymerase sigma-70 factor
MAARDRGSLPASTRGGAVPELVAELYLRSGASRWGVAQPTFATALEGAIAHRFGDAVHSRDEAESFARSLHLEDLALACACRDGGAEAWEHFIQEYRPTLLAAARTIGGVIAADDLMEALFADLYPGAAGAKVRTSLFGYYHGRARLSSWLRSVLAQRYVDRYRKSRRTVPLDETAAALAGRSDPFADEPHRSEYLRMAQEAFDAAVASLTPDERLRLRLYYGRSLTLAQIGRLVGEHEATVSRKLTRSRRLLRSDVESRLTAQGLPPAAIEACLEAARSGPELNASRLLAEEPE